MNGYIVEVRHEDNIPGAKVTFVPTGAPEPGDDTRKAQTRPGGLKYFPNAVYVIEDEAIIERCRYALTHSILVKQRWLESNSVKP